MATEHDVSGDFSDDVEEVTEDTDGDLADFLASLPKSVKRRIKALKKVQLDFGNTEAKFFEEVHALECKYHQLYVPLYEKRRTIVTGDYEPNDDECDFPSDDESTLATELKDKAKVEESAKEEPKEEAPVKGIPEFWLTIFKNVSLLGDMVQPHDEPILKHLTDIKSFYIEKPMGFKLEFHFEPNEYFTNLVLTKEYDMKCYPDPEDPFGFEGPEIYKCRGCTINWNKGKNVTLKTLKKKQKHKNRGVIRTVTKTVQNDSFFNFFSPPTLPEDNSGDDVDDEVRTLLTTDFEIGHYIRERIIPRAVLYFTGEGIEDEDEDYEEEEEEEDDDEEEEESDKDMKKEN